MDAHAAQLTGRIETSKRGKVALAILAIFAMVVTLLFASPPTPAAAVTDETPSFVLTQNDLEFILRQIQISEAHAADELNPSNYELYCPGQTEAQNCVSNAAMPKGVRTVDGSYNNLLVNQQHFGAADVPFPRLLPAEWQQADPEVADLGFEPNTPEQTASGDCDPGVTCYDQRQGNVYDSHPREISNLIVDQTTANPAIVNQIDAGTAIPVAGTERANIPNTAPDEGLSAPFNTFTGFFGQFFDHGLDLVDKGGNGTIIVPLNPDDPLYVDGGTSNFITLSRADRIDDGTETMNLTSPFIDQNQTYTSHPAHQVFLRQYTLVGGVPLATGHLIEQPGVGGMARWIDVKNQAATTLGIELTDADLLDVPQVVVDPYGNFVPGANGFPQLITGDPAAPTLVEGALAGNGTDVPEDVLGTGHAFLDDIAHGSTPVVDPDTGELLPRFDPVTGEPVLDPVTGEPVLTGYDNDALNAHYIAGDGRVNENIGLTAVHAVFHAEHNRMVGQIEEVLNGARPELEAQDSAERGGIAQFAAAFRGETHSYSSDKAAEQLPGYVPTDDPAATPVPGTADDWSYEERLFQAAKFATEMQYQHLVFEEFGRKIAPNIDAVGFNENNYEATGNPAITAEFAHVVYRFGHSMMTEQIGREPVAGGGTPEIAPDGAGDVTLLDGFLAPTLFDLNGQLTPEEAAGSLINGMTSRIGSQIDEHVVDVLRNNLLGLPLDLPTLNLMRGRDTGIPPLQAARATFFAQTGDPDLRPYANWNEFGLNTKNGDNFGRAGEKASLVNFVAAYGSHPTVVAATTLEEKRNAAALLVNGAPLGEEFVLRFAGPDRFKTAALISERAFPPIAGQATADVPVAYITNGQNFPDALAGGAAAAAEGGPILLSSVALDGDVPSATAIELTRLNPDRIVVLGDPNAVTQNTMAALAQYTRSGIVERVGGVNRFHTAALISQRFATPGEERVFIVNGLNFPDALAGSAVAARDGNPILLVTPDSIPAQTAAELQRLNPAEIVILGGTPSVNSAVRSELAAYTAGEVRRLAGADRYETALEISRAFFADGSGGLAFLATGANFPDALAGGVAAGLAGAPMLLVNPAGASPALMAELARLAPAQIHILGGLPSVPAAIEDQLAVLAPPALDPPADRLEFMNSTGAWANVGGQTTTGLEDVDFWIGGLAERLNPFGGMLGSSFNFVFETQLENLQFNDRFYYLFRNPGQQLFAALEGNTFSDIIQRNTDASNLPADIFALQDPVLDIDDFGGTLPAGLLLDGDGTYRWVGDEHVELHGTAGDDRMRGDEGDDSIWGYAGNDRMEGGAGNDALVGGTGNDILTDLFGDDNLKGKQGNDAIDLGSGIDLGIGGSGDDFLVKGSGEGTWFAGLGDDVVLGNLGRMIVFGGEHNDWIEGSASGQTELLQGDNASQTQNDTLGGDDVLLGRIGNDDVEGEGGNDILVGEATGTDRSHGNIGFDWITYYGQAGPVTADFGFTELIDPNNPLPHRWTQLEALSGGAGNDTLLGSVVEPGDIPASEVALHKLTQAAIDLIGAPAEGGPSLNGILRPDGHGDYAARFTELGVDTPGLVNNLIMGGPGSDTVQGRTGDDFIDGDSYVRARLTDGTTMYDSARELRDAVFTGNLDPGTLDIVRDVIASPNAGDNDVAVYVGSVNDYVITDLGDGYFEVAPADPDNPPTAEVAAGVIVEGTDVVRNIEQLRFDDATVALTAVGAVAAVVPDSPVAGSPATPSVITASLFQLDGTTPFDLDGATNVEYAWSSTATPVAAASVWADVVNPDGAASATLELTDDALVGQHLRVTVTWTDAGGVLRSVTSEPTANPVAAAP